MSANHQVGSPDHSLSIEEAAEHLHVSPATLRRRIKTGEIGAYKRTTVYGFEWRILLDSARTGLSISVDQELSSPMQNPDQDAISPTQPADGAPEAIKALIETIAHLRDDHSAEVDRLQKANEALSTAAEHWQARFLDEHDKVLRLLPAPQDAPATAEPEPTHAPGLPHRSWLRRLLGL